jgi:NAD(P)-binding Rossmann-like domain
MDPRYDAIIVGGGPGGLAVGALLSKRGLKTAVLEKNPWLGGRYRSIEFAGCRVDNGVHLLTGHVKSKEETFCKQVFDKVGLPIRQKDVSWNMGLVGREGSEGIEFFTMDRSKGVDAFFEFFAFGANMEMPDQDKKDFKKLFELMASLSLEERRKLVNVSWADWLEQYCGNPMVIAVLSVEAQLLGMTADRLNAGSKISNFHLFSQSGAVPFWYPEKGTLEDAIIKPLATFIEESGGKVLTDCTVRKVMIEEGRVTGVWARDNPSDLLHEIKAPIVVTAAPLYFNVGERRLLPREIFPPTWQQALDVGSSLSDEDLTGLYLLKKKIIPDEYYGWIHLFEASPEGMPVYVGDWLKGDFVNARVPKGKQLVSMFVTANNNTAPFGMDSSREAVNRCLRAWELAMERAFPGFLESIEAKGMTLQLNWGRHPWGIVPEEIDVMCPTVKGLYFAADSVRNVASLASDKVFEVALLCEDAIAAELLTSMPMRGKRGTVSQS